MKILFNKMMVKKASKYIALGLLNTNKEVFIDKGISPFDCLTELSTYGLVVRASPVINKQREITGYNFKHR